MPCPGGELPVRAVVSYWVPCHDERPGMDDAVAHLGERSDTYLVTESVYSDFGQRRAARGTGPTAIGPPV